MRADAPRYPSHPYNVHNGGAVGATRVKEMAVDGVSAEVLYPSLMLDQFSIKDPALQEACFRVYNDWLAEYCSHAPDRVFGICTISMYRIDQALKELERCKKNGMRGVMIWQVAPDDLSFGTRHYEKFWAAVQEMDMPVSMHANTGVPFVLGGAASWGSDAVKRITTLVNVKLMYAQNALTQFIFSGALERFPGLRVVLVENEVSWMPYFITQSDKFYKRANFDNPGMTRTPSEYFQRQIFSTFFNDPPSRWVFGNWGTDNFMWSNDFPHKNSTWPHSREVLARDLAHLSAADQTKLVHDNVMRLYKLPVIQPLATA
jgi:predicted TIM-barrel fold metal-dependent hydrolase